MMEMLAEDEAMNRTVSAVDRGGKFTYDAQTLERARGIFGA